MTMIFTPARTEQTPTASIARCRHHAKRILPMVRVLYEVVPTQSWVEDFFTGTTHVLHNGAKDGYYKLKGLRMAGFGYCGIELRKSNPMREDGAVVFQATNMSQLLVMAQMLEKLSRPLNTNEDEN